MEMKSFVATALIVLAAVFCVSHVDGSSASEVKSIESVRFLSHLSHLKEFQPVPSQSCNVAMTLFDAVMHQLVSSYWMCLQSAGTTMKHCRRNGSVVVVQEEDFVMN